MPLACGRGSGQSSQDSCSDHHRRRCDANPSLHGNSLSLPQSPVVVATYPRGECQRKAGCSNSRRMRDGGRRDVSALLRQPCGLESLASLAKAPSQTHHLSLPELPDLKHHHVCLDSVTADSLEPASYDDSVVAVDDLLSIYLQLVPHLIHSLEEEPDPIGAAVEVWVEDVRDRSRTSGWVRSGTSDRSRLFQISKPHRTISTFSSDIAGPS